MNNEHVYIHYTCTDVSLVIYIYIYIFMIKLYINARIMKFIPNEIRIMFSRVSSVIRVLDLNIENPNV